MTRTLAHIWQHIQKSFSVETNLNKKFETGNAILAATPKIDDIHDNEINLAAITDLLEDSSSFLDVLCLPLAQMLEGNLSYVSLGVNLLKKYQEINRELPSIEECTLIISQTAYLESIKEILSLYPLINWDVNVENLQNFSNKLRYIQNFELEETSLKNIFLCFHNSKLSEIFNQILLLRLVSPNVSNFLASLLTKRIAANTHRYIIHIITELEEEIQNLIINDFGNWKDEQQVIQIIDEYLYTHIQPQPLATFFDQSYSWKDIYIPIKAKTIDKYSHVVDLEAWVKGIILNPQKLEQVMLIEGDAGSGKSVFCFMFADWVRQHLYPLWTPILINLKNINYSGESLEEILEVELKDSLISQSPNWLNNKNTNFLFIFDGLDELNVNLEKFLNLVSVLQEKCKNKEEMGHRSLITCRTKTLQYVEKIPQNLERAKILELDSQLQEKWFKKWISLPENKGQKTDIEEYLSSKKCPKAINIIASEPLYLHLLSLMYRDDTLGYHNLETSNRRTARVVIWQEFINWLISKQNISVDNSEEDHQEHLNYQLNLNNLLTESAFAIIQSGGILASLHIIEARLENQQSNLLETLNKFYFLPAKKQPEKIECFHKSFIEFLYAEKLVNHLKMWSQVETETEIQEMNWQIYDFLGFGKISREIVDYVMGLLIQDENLHWVNLFKVLENFYSQWCDGKFIDTAEETLAQIKLKQLQQYHTNPKIQNLGQRQVDIYAGLNLMILLLEIQRYAQEHDVLKEYIIFYPSGETQGDNLTSDLLKIMNYCNCLQGDSFNSIVGEFFSATNLRATYLFQANLSGIDLSQADLSRAELSRTYLMQSNLSNAYLIAAKMIQSELHDANLSGANMIRTDLRGADLSNANLQDADLSRVDLSGANLKGANLQGAYMMGANLGDEVFGYARWDKNTNWKDVEGLEAAKNLPPLLKKQLNLE
ncbi:MAG: NACHT domain-containing protein [Nostocales cyanobacterium]|nr:MAG: NACHT domain-containing protein [Nostocales cyanobacterium]TAF13852.1 MAG: NACHT domain-containing protein [Nostocales cyanobacterium]